MRSNKNPFKSIFILGGTSELAQEICLSLIQKGAQKFHFVSRNKDKNIPFMNQIAKEYDVEVSCEKFELIKDNLEKKPKIEFFDLYIIAAGYLGDSSLANNNIEESIKIATINYLSLIPWIISITSKERISKPGSIWILSSVAADKGRPSNYHYGAAKAGLTIFCEGLFYRCIGKPFKVRVIKAGFVYTSMSKNKAPKLLSVSKKYFANKLIQKPQKEGVEYLPFWWIFIMKAISILPKAIVKRL